MKLRNIAICIALAPMLVSPDAFARNTLHHLPVADVLNDPEFAVRIEGVRFYFGSQLHPAVIQEFGEYRTNKKTNAFNKSDIEACNWVFKSALLALHGRAKSLGANAVINIRSNYKNNMVSSETEFTCGAGALMAGVALVGDFVNVE